MLDGYNGAVNAMLALVLMVSPQFFDDHGITPQDVKKIYAAAQARAAYIVETGDASGLAQLEDAVRQVESLSAYLGPAVPLLDKMAVRAGFPPSPPVP